MADSPPAIAFPERLDRTLRLGPFPSARDALRFATYAAVGTCLAPFVPAGVWLGTVAVGFVVAVWKPGGEAVERRLLRAASWQLRRARGARTMNPSPGIPRTTGAHLTLDSGVRVAVVRTAGLPLAYLPSGELAHRFDLFREIVRGLDGGFSMHVTLAPIHPGPFVPVGPLSETADRAARDGYGELVGLIARGRSVRRVYVTVGCPTPGSEGLVRLEAIVAALLERLGALGLRPVRLRDRALAEASRRIGLATGVERR